MQRRAALRLVRARVLWCCSTPSTPPLNAALVQRVSRLACRPTEKSSVTAADEEEEEAVADVTVEGTSAADEADIATAATRRFKLAVRRSCSSIGHLANRV